MRLSLAASFLFFASLLPAIAAPPGVRIEDAWARATPNGARTGAVYMVIRNRGSQADKLVRETSPVADRIQIHEMKVTNDIMQMREVSDGLSIAPDRPAVFKPGGLHMMLIGLKQPLRAGQDIVLTLRFEYAGAVMIRVPVKANGAR